MQGARFCGQPHHQQGRHIYMRDLFVARLCNFVARFRDGVLVGKWIDLVWFGALFGAR
jgi:hypothetical protein